jgi:hypothetical protein
MRLVTGSVYVIIVNSTKSAFSPEFSRAIQSCDLVLGRSGDPWGFQSELLQTSPGISGALWRSPELSGPFGEVAGFVEKWPLWRST